MHYCGVVAVRGALQLAMLEEVRTEEPPIRLNALFYEPGSAAEVAHELHTLGDVVIGVGAPLAGPVNGRPGRDCDALLLRRGVAPQAPTQETRIWPTCCATCPRSPPAARTTPGRSRRAPTGASRSSRRTPTASSTRCRGAAWRPSAIRSASGCASRSWPATTSIDDGGDLWHRRIEELDAAVCALCAHRYAVGHASWLGDPAEGVVVLPGASIPAEFERRGVMPAVERLHLSRA